MSLSRHQMESHGKEVFPVQQEQIKDVGTYMNDWTGSRVHSLQRAIDSTQKLMSMLRRHAQEHTAAGASMRAGHRTRMMSRSTVDGKELPETVSPPGGNPFLDTAKQMAGSGADAAGDTTKRMSMNTGEERPGQSVRGGNPLLDTAEQMVGTDSED